MGETEGNGCEVDGTVGTIVWVRRRNGSWWPGRILGQEELSANHLMSPRSGTPVKLLGRDDASVDWYNLEKSKRVKAFRCGEFDDCIEKAEKIQGTAIRKREKYARREDAILHALEIETEQAEKKQKKLGITNRSSSRLPPALKREVGALSEKIGNDRSKLLNHKSQSQSKGLDASLEEKSVVNSLYGRKPKPGKPQKLEDGSSEAIPRMRGLQDFGLRTTSKRRLSASVASEEPRKALSDDNRVPDLSNGSQSMEGTNNVSSNRNSSGLKRKTQVGLIDESLVKRRDRRRALNQVLQSSAKLPLSMSVQPDGDASLSVEGEKEQTGVICRAKRSQCVYLPSESNDGLAHTGSPNDQVNGDATSDSSTEEGTSSETIVDAGSDSSERDYLNTEIDDEPAVLSDSAQTMTVPEPISSKRYMTNCYVGQRGSISSEDVDDQIAAGAADVGMSKWQLKGKRNTRNLMKRPMDIGGKTSYGSIHSRYADGKVSSLKKRSLGKSLYHGSDAPNYAYDEDALIEKNLLHTQMPGFGNRRYPSSLRGVFKDPGRSSTDLLYSSENVGWEAEGLSQVAIRGYWDGPVELDPMYSGRQLGNGKKSVLIDVDVKARASYQGEHVPLVSLMSRLNGKAIIGHPVQIEALEDGSSNALLSPNDFTREQVRNDGNTSLRPAWRTARRTTMHRVRRPHPSTALYGDEGGDPSQDSDYEGKPPLKKPHRWYPSQKAGKSHQRPERRYSKKSMKKVSLLSQKTRMLSSIAIDRRPGGKACDNKLVNGNRLDGLIKPENGPTTITCIPVKLVFSRLLETVGRPPSRPGTHSIVNNGNTERKPS